MSIQRWMWIRDYPNMEENHSGKYVLYKDHVATVAAARAESYADGRVDGMRDVADLCYQRGVKAARDAVAALMSPPSDKDPTPLDFAIYEEVLPAIDALRGGS